jgi:hypothetical protein
VFQSGWKPCARVGVFVERRAVELAKPMRIRREMRRHPVQDDADADLVAAVDEAGETFRIAEAGRRRIEARSSGSPRTGRRDSVIGRNSIWVKPMSTQ